eukprot:scaffold48524_cov208-Isochrysis_galbana.AAC.1
MSRRAQSSCRSPAGPRTRRQRRPPDTAPRWSLPRAARPPPHTRPHRATPLPSPRRSRALRIAPWPARRTDCSGAGSGKKARRSGRCRRTRAGSGPSRALSVSHRPSGNPRHHTRAPVPRARRRPDIPPRKSTSSQGCNTPRRAARWLHSLDFENPHLRSGRGRSAGPPSPCPACRRIGRTRPADSAAGREDPALDGLTAQ